MLLGFSTLGCRQSGVVGELRDATIADEGTDPDTGESTEQLRQQCRDASFQLAVAGCIGFDVVAAYSSRCTGVDERVVRMFNTCARAGGCPAPSCLALLVPPPPPDPGPCQTGCDQQLSFSCVTSAEHTRCFSLCTRASAASSDAFIECASYLCNRSGCFAAFEAANPG